jgi:Rhodanese-related sulfurtransferase|tara:strand:- start:707 stop:1093 length:387 start_codon:yes stop_codon:yes gene_type:complete
MQTKTLESLLENANKEVKRLSFEESLSMINESNTIIIDVREESEVNNLGIIKNAIHIPRGLLEFTLVPNSSNNPVKIDDNTNILVYCAGGYRSALAAKTLKDLGFKNVYNLGGYSEWVDNGGDVQAHT